MKNKVVGLAEVTNDAKDDILAGVPYQARVTIEGVAAILFHRYSVESVKEKADSKKGSKAKKTDDIESYVYRDAKNDICIPGEYLRCALVEMGRNRQDPRSPRKSARDLYKAIIISLTELATLGKDTWDFLDQRRVVIQRSAISRVRPAFQAGWRATFILQIQQPEYLGARDLNSLIVDAGKFVGLGDFRPSYGRFNVVAFELL